MVKILVTIGHRSRRVAWSLPRSSALLAGLAVLPSQSGNIALLPHDLQLNAIEGSPNASRLNQIAPLPYGDFVSPIGSPDSALSFASPWRSAGLPDTLGSDPMETPGFNPAATVFNHTAPPATEEFGVAAGGGAQASRAAREGIHAVCGDDRPALRLESGGESWTSQGVHATPVQFPPGVFTGSTLTIANPLGDPTIGPSGDRSNLQPPGATGAWCRPSPVPFSQSSPLASRAFWTPFVVVLFGLWVFWASRGLKLRDVGGMK